MNEQPDAEPKGIDLDDVDRAYDKWAEHRNGHSRLDAFRAGVEFGLRHNALAQSGAGPVAFAPIETDPIDPTREYIPLPAQWEIQTKGKGSSYRLLDRKSGERMTIMLGDSHREHDFVTRMAKEIHAAGDHP